LGGVKVSDQNLGQSNDKSADLKSSTPRRLSPWNPLDHLRLLWWVLVIPQRLMAYREVYGENDEQKVGRWLVVTFVCFAAFVVTLAYVFGTLPHTINSLSLVIYWCVLSGVFLIWALIVKNGKNGSRFVASRVLLILEVHIALLVAYIVWDKKQVCCIGVVVTLLLMQAANRSLANRIEGHVEMGHSSWLMRGVFGLLMLIYVWLIWFSFLGGWRTFQ
jgi:hypothetical protein